MPQLVKTSIFAAGASGQTQPDSVTIGDGSVWIEYGNGADSTGLAGSSTIVRYSASGAVQHTFTVAGSADGLKVDPATGTVFVLQNQDGNSTLSLIDPATDKLSAPVSYAVTSATSGYDDVAFDNGSTYLSYTNPNGAGDPVVQRLVNGDNIFGKLVTTNILLDGAMGTNIATGKIEAIPLNDPDSLKTLPNGSLVLTSGDDKAFTIISDPGTKAQAERFVQLQNLPAGSGLDDVIVPTSSSGTFYVANSGTDQVEAFKLTGLNTSDAYASVGTEIVQVDLQTGAQTVVVAGLSGSHGMSFVPDAVKLPRVLSERIFALGSDVSATAPDSLTTVGDTTWVEYGNTSDSTGTLPDQGSSTIVQYGALGQILHTYTLPGSIDGLKYDPVSGLVFALKNQDANSFLYTIDPATHAVSAPLAYAAPPYVYGANSAHGYDDVAFVGGRVFIDPTNPSGIGDPVLQILDNGNDPKGVLKTTTILRLGDTGTNLVTGRTNQVLPVADPDSLKSLADGTLIMTSDHDTSLTFIHNPGTTQQTASFVTLPAGASGLDDAVVPTATAGTFTIANGGGNDVLKVAVSGLNLKDIYLSVGSDNAVDQLDPTTGALTPFIVGLNAPHGLLFAPGGPLPQSSHTANAASAFPYQG